MSIKGSFKTLYVGKQHANIIYYLKKNQKIVYDDLSRIEYSFADKLECGYLDFIYPSSKVVRFDFRKRANDKISRTIKLIQENNPNLLITTRAATDLPFYQRTVFVVLLMLFCCAPVGLFLMWYYKKFSKPIMTLITTFLIFTWCAGLWASYNNYTILVSQTNDTFEQIYNNQVSRLDITNSSEVLNTEAFSTTLTAGHYLVGTDIPVGTYSFYSKKGMGNLISSDGKINAIFNHDSESFSSIGLDDFGTEELNNIYLDEGVTLSVTGTQQISAGCSDGMVSSMKPRNQEGLQNIELGYGHYGASDDIPAGTYDVEWIEGNGNIICASSIDGGINEIMGDSPPNSVGTDIYIKNFRNLTLKVGDVLEIDDIKVKLIPSK